MKYRFLGDPGLDRCTSMLVERHSLLNILTVVSGELLFIDMIVKLGGPITDAVEAINRFSDLARTVALHSNLSAAAEDIFNKVDLALRLLKDLIQSGGESLTTEKNGLGMLSESTEAIERSMTVLEARLKELFSRDNRATVWEARDLQGLMSPLGEFFDALNIVGRGRYTIGWTDGPSVLTYPVKFAAEGRGGVFLVPEFIDDIIRDLVANSRKYSPAGGLITVDLTAPGQGRTMTLKVADRGIGIPEIDLPNVVKFGYRGSNTEGIRTTGGGFGLTKVWSLTRSNGGTLDIDSTLGTGTSVELFIPAPGASRPG